MASSIGSRFLLAAATLATASGAYCPNNCTGHGGCIDGACACDFGWTNSDCSVKTCLRACSGRGLCYAGTCHCQPGWRGEACSIEQHECGNGVWSVALGHCDCDEGWRGEHCGVPACAEDCHGRGECVQGVCQCHRGFGGEDCESKACARSERGECAGIGKCTNATCHCPPYAKGLGCELRACPGDCSFRGLCLPGEGRCLCPPGWGGPSCNVKECAHNCSGHGTCSEEKGFVCECDAGWADVDCAQRSCGAGCEHDGLCHEGTCYCKPGFHGPSCQYTLCPDGCNGHGVCINGTCTCEDGWGGPDCAELTCPRNCGEHGRCLLGQDCADCATKRHQGNLALVASGWQGTSPPVTWRCECEPGWAGATCEEPVCTDTGLPTGHPTDCGAGAMHGLCIGGSCQCAGTRSGAACEVDLCAEGCGEDAVCRRGLAQFCQHACATALPQAVAVRCQDSVCPSPPDGAPLAAGVSRAECGGNGECYFGKCHCRAGFTGDACGVPACEGGCGQHGNCVAAPGAEEPPACVCFPGYGGADCSVHTCPGDCSGVGFCSAKLNYTCVCPAGRTGPDCSQKACHRDCTEPRAACVEGACVCASGWHGPVCEFPMCDKGCSGHGTCEPRRGGCVCDDGWFGQDCSQAKCPNDCHAATHQGTCHDGKCTCAAGWGGVDCASRCSESRGKLACGGHGQCFNSKCHCEPGWTGHFCGQRTCLLHCSGNGFCNNGSCTCAAGYAGRDCARATAPTLHDCRYGCVRSCSDECVHAQRPTAPGGGAHEASGWQPKGGGGGGGGGGLVELEENVYDPRQGAAGGCFASCRRECIGKCSSQLALPAVDTHSGSVRADSDALGRDAARLSLGDAMRIADSALMRPDGPAQRREGAL